MSLNTFVLFSSNASVFPGEQFNPLFCKHLHDALYALRSYHDSHFHKSDWFTAHTKVNLFKNTKKVIYAKKNQHIFQMRSSTTINETFE